jgi:hypothetical protein
VRNFCSSKNEGRPINQHLEFRQLAYPHRDVKQRKLRCVPARGMKAEDHGNEIQRVPVALGNNGPQRPLPTRYTSNNEISIISDGYRGVKRQGLEADHSPPTSQLLNIEECHHLYLDRTKLVSYLYHTLSKPALRFVCATVAFVWQEAMSEFRAMDNVQNPVILSVRQDPLHSARSVALYDRYHNKTC